MSQDAGWSMPALRPRPVRCAEHRSVPRGRDQGFGYGFAHGTGREFAPRFGHPLTNGFGHGFVQSGGFGRR